MSDRGQPRWSTGVDIEAALALIDEWIVPQGPAGAGAVVWHRGEVVASRYAGEARPGVPVTAETIFGMASITKPIAATTVMTLVERGLVSLDESVVRLVPDFRMRPGEDGTGIVPELERMRPTITVRQLLAHASGLPEDLAARDDRYTEPTDLDTIVTAMCRAPLQSAPGARVRYSNTGYGVVTRLVEEVTGESFWTVTRRNVLDPLGLPDIVARPGADLAIRLAIVGDAAQAGTAVEMYNSDYWRSLAVPWGGLFGTPAAAVRFAAAFLSHGPRLLSEAGVAAMMTDQTLGAPGGVESGRVAWDVAHWGLGWEVKGTKRRHWTGDLTSARTICHFGHAGTLLWADPERDLALAVFCNRTVTRMWTFILPRWARLSNAVVAAATR
ncbi:MAG: beta-lactamase family protein [Chloroflexota bacterium]|nr:beta-lactamase family protein [Chloroflexota bacterium]